MLRVAGPPTFGENIKKAVDVDFVFSELTKLTLEELYYEHVPKWYFRYFGPFAGVNASYAQEDSNWTMDMIKSRWTIH